jgi:iron complex outermembrane recepter protein
VTRAGAGRRAHRTPVSLALALSLASLLPTAARGDDACPSAVASPGVAHQWASPLDRPVSLHGRDISLRNALDHLAAAARIRMSYTAELLPLDQRVCGEIAAVPAGDALRALLRGTSLEPVIVGPDQVVLAPSAGHADSVRDAVAPRLTTNVLDRVVVTGSESGTPQRPLAIALDVVTHAQIVGRGATTFAGVLDGAIPGVWIWEQAPSSFLSRYASLRGASSFGINYPKIYIDGIEVANPLLLTHFFPDAVERIEVIRGPQGAALYGADAISGVINVVTRHEGVDPSGHRLQFQSTAGVSQSDFTSGAFVQQQTVLLRSGSSIRSAGLGLSVSSVGAFIPDGGSRTVGATGDARIIGARSSLSLTGRFFAERAGPAISPLLSAWITSRGETTSGLTRRFAPAVQPPDSTVRPLAVAPTEPQAMDQFTLGATGTLMQSGVWTHSVVAGVDGYRLSNVIVDTGPIPSAADSALRAARGNAVRGTLRVSSVAQFGRDDHASAKITFAAEHSALREATAAQLDAGGAFLGATRSADVAWRLNTGLIAQGNVTLRNSLFLTGGARLERNAGYTSATDVSLLPMLGAAYVRSVGAATLKFRAAYGKGIRPPQTSLHQDSWRNYEETESSPTLSPEVQSGIEGGMDLLLGRSVSLHVTRFDQLASGLIQSVAIVADSQPAGPPQGRRVAYQLQNVGEISNRGWEFQGTAQRGPLSLSGAVSLVQSQVQRVIAGYSGDLRVGDRMLEVPARTASLTMTWTGPPWEGFLGLSRASDWVNYDRIALMQALATSTRGPGAYVGARLRDYWRVYGGVTRLRASMSRDLPRGFSLVLSGENLLGQQRGEPDNATVVPGRTISLGFRLKF